MKFTLTREVLLKPLQQVVNVVEKRQTLPVLSNLLFQVDQGTLTLTATDLEVELVANVSVQSYEKGETTVPARKIFDLCRSLPDGTELHFEKKEGKVTIKAGRSRYTLSTLSANDFPTTENMVSKQVVKLSKNKFKHLLEHTAFAMAHQDVRYFLNGMLIEANQNNFRTVATDGHRLACCDEKLEESISESIQIILPRKAVLELSRLLDDSDEIIKLEFGDKHFRVSQDDLIFTSKLIDGKYPEYEAVIPIGADHVAKINKQSLIETIRRASILSSEKYRGVKLELSTDNLKIIAHNTEQEEAVEEVEMDYHGDELKIGFNYAYLLDALNALKNEDIHVCFKDAMTSCLIQDQDDDSQRHVVMPLKL